MNTKSETEVINSDVPRHERTPKIEAARAIQSAYESLQSVVTDKKSADDLFDSFMESLWTNEDASGDFEVESYTTLLNESPNDAGDHFFLWGMGIACAYSVESIREYESGNINIAWSLSADARYWAGMLSGYSAATSNKDEIAKELASKYGKSGSYKRHEPMRNLKAWAIQKYQGGAWNSANKAAHDLKALVIAHGRTIGAVLTEENAQRTIAEWFRKSV